MTRKPKLPFRGPASAYEGPRERIVEFEGGLISFRRQDDGRIIVELYRLDPSVIVVRPAENAG